MMRRLLCVCLLFSLGLTPAWAARQFSGTGQCAYTTASLDFTGLGTNKLSLAFWLWWDTFGTDDHLAAESGTGGVASAVQIDPNDSSNGDFSVTLQGTPSSTYTWSGFTRPSAGAWHHYVFTFDGTTAGTGQLVVYLDGSAASLTNHTQTGGTHGFDNLTWNFMGRTCGGTPSLVAAGRLAEVAIWTGLLLDGTDAAALYNSGSGAAATTVQNGNLAYYWHLCGTSAPEPATVGSTSLTLVGSPTQATHPVSGQCGGGGGGTSHRRAVIQ